MSARDQEFTFDASLLPSPPDPANTGVPPLEPPTLTSQALASRLRDQWWFDRWRESPCWLASMVVHLAIMVVFGSILRPPGTEIGGTTIELTLGNDDDGEPTEPMVSSQQDGADDEEGGEEGDQEEASTPEEEKAAQEEEQNAEDTEPAQEEETEQTPENEQNQVDENDTQDEPEPQPEEAPPASPDPFTDASDQTPADQAELSPDQPPTQADGAFVEVPGAVANVSNNLRWIREARLPEGIASPDATDDIVDAFIEYDVGLLRGAAGRKALRAFEQLDEQSLPALVRGLNKSASIQASCPVGVISTKLNYQMRRTKDPALIRYALDNLGRGVPIDAPHRLRVESLRERLRQHFLDLENRHKKLLVQRGVPFHPQLIAELNSLAGSDVKNLRLAMKDPNEMRRLAAILAMEHRDDRLQRSERRQFAQQLINEIRTGTPETQWQAHLSLRRLAQGYLPRSPQATQLRAGLDEEWSDLWAKADRFETERSIEVKLAQAGRANEVGRSMQAAQIYRDIMNTYPNSEFSRRAEAAFSKLDIEPLAASRLKLAAALERVNKAAAIRRYNEVVTDFAGTKSALEAQVRLKALQSQ